MAARRPATLWFHPDPLRLQAALAAQIETWQEDRPLARILVVAPSRRLVSALRTFLAGRFPALLGVEVLTHQGLGYRLAALDPEAVPPPLLPRDLRHRLAAEVVTEGGGDLGAYAGGRRGPCRALGSVLRELREAGLPPEAVRGAAPELGALLASYESALDSLAEREGGGTDRAGLARHAVRAAAKLSPVRGVISYGAYELVGMNLDLLRSIPAEEELTFLIPGDPDAPASAYATEFARRHLGAEPRRLPDLEPLRPFVEAAVRVHDPESTGGGPLDPDRIHLVRVQGPEAELTFVARDILGKVAGGVPPDEIGVVARSLEPYAPLAETVFERHRLPVDSSLGLPLLRHPRGQVLSLLVRALEEDFPRQTVLELVRSPAFHAPARQSEGWRPHRWDVWSRAHGVTRGLSSWRELPERLRNASRGPWSDDEEESREEFRTRCEANAASAELLVRRLEDMKRTWEEAARSPRAADHARALRRLAEECIHRWENPRRDEREVTRALQEVLADLERLDAVRESVPRRDPQGDAPRPAPGAASLVFVREALAEARLPWSEPGGVAFLDIMQARGLRFRHLYLIGFNADLFPIRRREDPFLPDAFRRRLREATGRPLAVRDEGIEEEHLLLSLTLAAAEETLTVTWQGADASGRERPVSLYLRELARGMEDAPPLRTLVEGGAGVVRVPTHPAEAARWYAERKPAGLVSLEEAAVGTSHFAPARGVEAVRDLLHEVDPGHEERLRPGLSLVSAMESFTAESLPYDGRLDAPLGHRHPLSATGLAMLGRCPLRFFFRYTLGVKPLDGAAREDRMHPRDLGTHVHKVLECVYRRLDEEGALGPGAEVEALRAAGRIALETEWTRVVAPFASRLRERYPVLLDHSLAVWRGELERFLDEDLARMAKDGHSLEGLELAWRETVPLEDETGDPVAIEVWGFPDRVTRRDDGVRHVSDYKTRGNLGKQVRADENLRAHRPQLPLYLELAKIRGDVPATAEILGIGPELKEEFRLADTGPVQYDAETLHAVEEGFPETLAVLGGLPVRGLYPFHPDPYQCSWCEFRLACRQSHYATARRVEAHPAFDPYFLTQKKTKTQPRLAKLRAKENAKKKGKRS